MSLHRGPRNVDLVKAALERWPDRVAFVQDGASITYRQAADLIARMARVLADRGVGPGGGVAVLAPNRAEAWLALTAATFLGGRYTPLHPLGSLDDQAYSCQDAEIDTLIYDPSVFDERAAQLASRLGLKRVLALGPSQTGEDLVALAHDAPATDLKPADTDVDHVNAVLYTGGTTGRPKGVVHTTGGIAYSHLLQFSAWQHPPDIRYLAAAPITHASGMPIVPTLLKGGTIHLLKGFDPAAWLATIARERITMALVVPTIVYALLDHPGTRATDLSSLETILYTAAPISPSRLVEAIDVFGPVFMQNYGQTESAGLGTALWKEHHLVDRPDLLASCGRAVAGLDVAVLDESGKQLADGEPGEICIRGPSIMRGYWKQDDLNAETLAYGWLHTGDMAVRDPEGFFTIVDRKKDMIVSGGFNVFPREIEDVLTAHPAVAMAAVVGVPDEKWGEAVKAIVVAKPGATIPADELIALVKERKGPVYAPKSVEVVDELPLTAVGKADKKALRARYWQGQERGVH